MRYSIISNLGIYQRIGEGEGGYLVINLTLTQIFPKLL